MSFRRSCRCHNPRFFFACTNPGITLTQTILQASLPVEQRIAPRPVKPGTLDITATGVFIDGEEHQQQLLSLVQAILLHDSSPLVPLLHLLVHLAPLDVCDWRCICLTHSIGLTLPYGPGGRHTLVIAVLRILFRTLRTVYAAWHQKTYLTDSDVDAYAKSVVQIQQCWHAFKWKPSVWLHWLVAHSTYFIRVHRSMYLFSSIPSEHKHQSFKRDIRHSFQGWKLVNPRMSIRGLRHVVELDGIDQTIRLMDVNSKEHTPKKRK